MQGFELNAAEWSVERDGDRFGFRLDAGHGEMFRIMNLADGWRGPNRYISQAIFSYKPSAGLLRLDFGKFYTSAGAEGPETYNNFNYSRSLLFTLGEPGTTIQEDGRIDIRADACQVGLVRDLFDRSGEGWNQYRISTALGHFSPKRGRSVEREPRRSITIQPGF
jgi:hypothetical protein